MVVECVVWRQTNVQLLSSEISPALPGWFTSVSLLPNLCCNIYNLHFASHSTYTNSHLQHDFLCWLYFSNYFCRLSIKFKVFALLLSLCSCSKQLAGCLHTSQREIDWGGGVPGVVWVKLASVVMKMLRKKNSLSAFIWIEVHTGRRLWGRFGLWELEKKPAFMFVWDGELTAHLQSQSYVLAFSQALFLPEDPGSDFYPWFQMYNLALSWYWVRWKPRYTSLLQI